MSKEIIKRIERLLEAVESGITEENIKDVTELLEHNEMGEALSLICTQVYEYDVSISSETYQEIESLGQQMEMNASEWQMLKELVE